MVSGILPHAKKRLKRLIKEDEFKAKIYKAFQDLETTLIMGNLLSHNNMLAGKVSIEEVNRFCESVHNLHNTFLCPNCGNFIGYYRDLKIIRCSNPRCENPVEVKTKWLSEWKTFPSRLCAVASQPCLFVLGNILCTAYIVKWRWKG